MNKFEPSPNPHITHDTPGNTRPANPGKGETAHRQKRPRAPQFGSDRRNARDLDAQRPTIARTQGDPSGLAQNASGANPSVERRHSTQDRRRSWA